MVYHVGEYEIYHTSSLTSAAAVAQPHYRVCSVDNDRPIVEYDSVQSSLSTVTTTFSLIALAFHILVHTAFKKLRTPAAQHLLGLACSLFVAQGWNSPM
jgi:hypothetical protein